MKAVHLLVNSQLPPDLRNYEQVYTNKTLNKILSAVARKHPEAFADTLKGISDIGRKASYIQGETMGLSDFIPVLDKKSIFAKMDAEVAALPKGKDFTQGRREIFQKYNELIERDTSTAALKNRNNIAMAVLSGARGKSAQLKALNSTPGTYSDYKDQPIDIFSRESVAEGIRPAVFLASTYGARKSVISTKCLKYDTLVRMGDLTEKRICDIVVGDLVLGADRHGNVCDVSVVNVFDQGFQDCWDYTLESVTTDATITITCTAEHKFLDGMVNGDQHLAGDLETCDTLAAIAGDELVEYSFVAKTHRGKHHCFDIEVNHSDHLFVLASGLITSNSSTAKGGDWAKQMAAVAADLIIRKDDCGTQNGISQEIDDSSLPGRVLARDTAGIPAGTLLGREQLSTLRKAGVKNVIARSAMTCGNHTGLCAKCVGKFFDGGKEFPKIGTSIGAIAATTVSQPITQMALSTKHSGGMTASKREYAGLDYIQQFSQSPETFKDKAAVSELDGKVDSVEPAEQGGFYVSVGGQKHYVPSGHEVTVTPGATVEAGDQLAEGLMDAEDVVRLKGLGAGRLYYAQRLNQMLADSGAGMDKRNSEVIARAALRHVRILDDEGIGCYLPDDIADYDALQASYRPPETSQTLLPKKAIGKYLQKPLLHYTVGTRITPNVAKALEENSIGDVLADDKAPSFEPEMVRLRTASHVSPDWLASMSTSYISKQLNEASTRGDDTNIKENEDYRPRLAIGAGFGEDAGTTGKF